MSGLLRRIKRSRTADAGDRPADQQAAGPEGEPTTAATEAGPAPTAPAGGETSQPQAATPPAIMADPDRPAGLDAGEATPRPAGRRGRLRRRLRYLRRARELMLRDLGGLVYEVHRTGGGDFGKHAGVVGGKIERLASLDAEAGAIEAALGAPRSETVVFEPGVGGTCDVCGELYGSAARFCSNCGSATDPAARPAPEPEPAPESRPVPPMPKPPGAAAEEDRPTEELATGDTAAGADEPAAQEPAAAASGADEPAAQEPAAAPSGADEGGKDAPADEPARPDRPADPDRNPFSGTSNGRPEDERKPPELSPGDPLATRESRE
jgi:hypothetical protein